LRRVEGCRSGEIGPARLGEALPSQKSVPRPRFGLTFALRLLGISEERLGASLIRRPSRCPRPAPGQIADDLGVAPTARGSGECPRTRSRIHPNGRDREAPHPASASEQQQGPKRGRETDPEGGLDPGDRFWSCWPNPRDTAGREFGTDPGHQRSHPFLHATLHSANDTLNSGLTRGTPLSSDKPCIAWALNTRALTPAIRPPQISPVKQISPFRGPRRPLPLRPGRPRRPARPPGSAAFHDKPHPPTLGAHPRSACSGPTGWGMLIPRDEANRLARGRPSPTGKP
jgi:hypothetical protein